MHRTRRTSCTWRTWRTQYPPRRQSLTYAERPGFCPRARHIRVEHHDDVSSRGGIGRLAQSSKRQHPPASDLARRRHQHIEITCELHVLKPVVENVNRRAQPALGKRTGQKAILGDGDDGLRHRAGEQHGFIAGAIQVRKPARAVRDDDHAISTISSSVATAEDCGTLAGVEERACDQRDHRRFCRAPDAQVADADDRALEATPGLRVALEPAPPGRDCPRIEKIKQWA
jgi:hypothetical protein